MLAALLRTPNCAERDLRSKQVVVRMLVVAILSLCCLGQSRNGVVLMVRHAEKESDAKDALLSDIGQKRAECLAHFLENADLGKILVTRVVRTQQTAEPAAKQFHLKPIVLDADDIDAFVKNLRAEPNANALVVGHSDTLPKIIEQLGGGRIAPIEGSEYDKIFVVHPESKRESGSTVTLRYCDCK